MTEKLMLFTLPNCDKCKLAQEYLKGVDYMVYLLPKSYKDWKHFDIDIIKKYDIMDDIQTTAPILVVPETKEKFVGLLRIKRWVDGSK